MISFVRMSVLGLALPLIALSGVVFSTPAFATSEQVFYCSEEGYIIGPLDEHAVPEGAEFNADRSVIEADCQLPEPDFVEFVTMTWLVPETWEYGQDPVWNDSRIWPQTFLGGEDANPPVCRYAQRDVYIAHSEEDLAVINSFDDDGKLEYQEDWGYIYQSSFVDGGDDCVEEPVEEPEEEEKGEVLPETLPNTGPGAALMSLFGIGGLGVTVRSWLSSRKQLVSSLLK